MILLLINVFMCQINLTHMGDNWWELLEILWKLLLYLSLSIMHLSLYIWYQSFHEYFLCIFQIKLHQFIGISLNFTLCEAFNLQDDNCANQYLWFLQLPWNGYKSIDLWFCTTSFGIFYSIHLLKKTKKKQIVYPK